MAGLEELLPCVSASVAETRTLGRRIALVLPAGAVLALEGDLGAGKTELVRGLVVGLGGDGDAVTSPTFAIAQHYEVDEGFALHVDAYRVEDPREFIEMGFGEYADEARVTAVEWPGKMGAALPAEAIHVRIIHVPGGSRQISLG